jgi:transmembrane sensor
MMKTDTDRVMDSVHGDAERWFARLRAPDCSAGERDAFERWCAESNDNAAAYREVERLWHRSGALHRYADIAAEAEVALRDVAPRRSRWQLPLAAAALLLLSIGVGVLQPWKGSLYAGGEQWITATGEQRSIELADGSRVLLDAESELRVLYTAQQRSLMLGKGQAQFSVQKDAQRPFVVRAGNGAVTALGTQFQVRVIGDDVTVTLLEGKVSVDVASTLSADKTETLTAGEQIRFDRKQALWAKRAVDLEVAQGWTYGDLVFKGWRLQDLVAEMNRYSDTKVHVEDASLNELLISGRFHAGDYQTMLAVLESDWPVRAETVSATEVALYRR